MGVECLYVTQSQLAGQISSAIASSGFINRGPKKRTDLFFLNNTEEPAILIETCFVDSTADADIYKRQFGDICDAIAGVLGGAEDTAPPTEPQPPEGVAARVDIAIAIEGDVQVTVNGQTIEIVGHGR
jgi:hypothetical protein